MSLTTLISATLFLFFTLLSQAKDVDLFISGGQSNANYKKKAFGVRIENIVTQSSAFSNAEVVKTARGGTPLIKWMDDDGTPQECYHQHFFNHSGEGRPGQLEQRIQDIKDRGDTVRFRGFFGFREKRMRMVKLELMTKEDPSQNTRNDSSCFSNNVERYRACRLVLCGEHCGQHSQGQERWNQCSSGRYC